MRPQSVREIVQSVVDEALAAAREQGVAIDLSVAVVPGSTMRRDYDSIDVVGRWRGEEHRVCAGTTNDARPAFEIRYALRRWLRQWMQEARGKGDKTT